MFSAIACGIASAFAGGAMSTLFGGGQKAASGGIPGVAVATAKNTVGVDDAGVEDDIQSADVPNADEAVRGLGCGDEDKVGSGRRQHTMSERDWSSDVCSSD